MAFGALLATSHHALRDRALDAACRSCLRRSARSRRRIASGWRERADGEEEVRDDQESETEDCDTEEDEGKIVQKTI